MVRPREPPETPGIRLSEGAPVEVIEEFVRWAMGYISRRRTKLGPVYTNYIKSDEFVLRARPVYMSRMRSVTPDGHGKHRSLYDSVDRLIDRGLVWPSDIDNTLFLWTRKPTYTRLGYCATMVRLIVISSAFDDEKVDEKALDYVVYHEIIHNRIGYRPFDRNPHDATFRRYERMYPDLDDVNAYIRALHIAHDTYTGGR